MAPTQRIGNLLLSPSTGLQSLMEKAAILRHLTQTLRQTLNTPLNQHISVANIRNNTLVIAADTSAWLTRARFHAPAILKLIRQETGLKQLTKVHFKVINADVQRTDFVSQQASMSESAALLLDSTARGIKDPALKAAVKRLSRNHS